MTGEQMNIKQANRRDNGSIEASLLGGVLEG
jgi:hypothetical protein